MGRRRGLLAVSGIVVFVTMACGTSSETGVGSVEEVEDAASAPEGAASPFGDAATTPPRPRPPLLQDAGVEAKSKAECEARPTLECSHCEGCPPSVDAQMTFDALLKKCGRLCGDVVVELDVSGCAETVAVAPDQQGRAANLECLLEVLRSQRWSCGERQTVGASFGSYCSK